jgi:transposase
MLSWIMSFGKVCRVGIECSGTHGLGLLRYMQTSGIEVLEVIGPQRADRRKRGKDDTLDAENAENAENAAFSRLLTVTPKTRDGMVESLRVLKSCRRRVVAARTVALQMIRTCIV